MPNFVAISQIVAEMWRFFDFSNMAAFRHLGFVMRVFGPPTKGIWWSLSLCKIWLYRCSSFDNMHVFWFREFGLKMPIDAPKIGVLGDSNETYAPTANPPNSAQLGGSPFHSPKLHPGPCSSVDVRPLTDRHTDIQTHIRGWPQYISASPARFYWVCQEVV